MAVRLRLVALAALGLAVAAVLALVADAVFAVERDLKSPTAAVHPSPGLRSRVAVSLIGAGDDRELRAALLLVEQSRLPGASRQAALALHGEAEARLSELAREGGDPVRRAQAANLSGILLYEDALLDPPSAARYLELSLGAFREAVKLDPANEDAKVNLELVAGVLREREERVAGQEGSAGDGGAGSSPEGSGY